MEDNSLKAVYEQIADIYAAKFSEPSDHIDDFLSSVKQGGRILDVGCGPGVDSAYMTSKGFYVIGIDMSEKMLELAEKKNPNVKFEHADMRHLDFTPDTFDGVLASFSLIHVPKSDVPGVLKEMYKILSVNGMMCIGIQEGKPQETYVAEPLKPIRQKLFLNIMSVEELKGLILEAGFTIDQEFMREAENKEELGFRKYIIIAKK